MDIGVFTAEAFSRAFAGYISCKGCNTEQQNCRYYKPRGTVFSSGKFLDYRKHIFSQIYTLLSAELLRPAYGF